MWLRIFTDVSHYSQRHHKLYVSCFFCFFAASSFTGSIFALIANRWKEEILSEHLLIIKFCLCFLNETRNPQHFKKRITIHKVICILVNIFLFFFTFQATEWWYTCQVCLRRLRKTCRKAKVSLSIRVISAYCLPYKLSTSLYEKLRYILRKRWWLDSIYLLYLGPV